MKKRYGARCIWLIWLVLLPLNTGAQPLHLSVSGRSLPVPEQSVSVWVDSTASVSFEQVRQMPFRPHPQPVLSFGSSKAAVWLRFQVVTGTPGGSSSDGWLLESSNYLIEDVRFYSVSQATGRVHTGQQGVFFLDSPRDIQTNRAYFWLFPPDAPTRTAPDTATVYLRVQNYMPLTVSLRLLTVQQLAEESHRNDLFHGVLFGVLMAMMLYNFFLLLVIRDRAYLYYVLYVALTIVATDTEGYVNEFVFAQVFPAYSRYASVLFSLTLISAILFARQFLSTASHSPRIDRFLLILVAGCFVPPLGVWLNKPLMVTHGMEIMLTSTALSLWGIGLYLLRRGLREARYYALAWSVLWLGIIVFVCQLNGWLPHNLLTINAVRVGAALETILLSFALADRINVLRREKALAQTRLVETVRETEQTKTRLAESENKLLRAHMNPHFLFNSLNAIQRYILSKEPLVASEYLTRFANLMRFNLDQSRQPTITLHQEIEMLTVYLQLEALRFDRQFAYTFEVSPDVNPHELSIPGMMLQPFVENAIWHGLMHKPDGGHIRICFQLLTPSRLRCMVEDDGVGRERAAQIGRNNRIQHRSAGLSLTTERLNLLNRDGYIGDPVQLTDLYAPDGTPTGTRVTIDLPI